VPFDDIAVDEGGVARGSPRRDTVLGFERGQLRIFREIDAGSKILQVPDPPRAAPSAGLLVHLEADAGEIRTGRQG
jgi:hypothetical protein